MPWQETGNNSDQRRLRKALNLRLEELSGNTYRSRLRSVMNYWTRFETETGIQVIPDIQEALSNYELALDAYTEADKLEQGITTIDVDGQGQVTQSLNRNQVNILSEEVSYKQNALWNLFDEDRLLEAVQSGRGYPR